MIFFKLYEFYLHPKDVARVESRTVICTADIKETIPTPRGGYKNVGNEINLKNLKCTQLGNWMSLEDMKAEIDRRFPGCMKGRTMYVIPYSMGSVGGSLSKIGIEITGNFSFHI